MRNIIPQFVVAFTVILSSFLSMTEIRANPRDDLYKKVQAVKAEIDRDVDNAYKVIETHLDSLKPQMHACLAQQSGQKEGVFSSLKNFHIEDETESKQREFSAESWLDD